VVPPVSATGEVRALAAAVTRLEAQLAELAVRVEEATSVSAIIARADGAFPSTRPAAPKTRRVRHLKAVR
jgi:anti-sigma-K factor RskA